MFDLGCAWDSVPYAERRMAVGKSWLAGWLAVVMMMMMPLLLAAGWPRVGDSKKDEQDRKSVV